MGSTYHIDPSCYPLERFWESLGTRTLIPSRRPLAENLRSRFTALTSAGIKTLADLLRALKNKKEVAAFAERSGLDVGYLTLLRREVGSYFPNPVSLKKLPGVDGLTLEKLEAAGIKNSKTLYDTVAEQGGVNVLAASLHVDTMKLFELYALADLSRLYGVGPIFARMLYDVGIDSVKRFVSMTPAQTVTLYEEKTGSKADFAERDIEFTLEIARDLE